MLQIQFVPCKLSSLPIVLAEFFNVVPVTQYVYLDDTVTFECASNLTEFIFFKTNLSVQISQTKGVFNLTASNEVNRTAVTCYTFNGNSTEETEPAYVYVQGWYIHQCIIIMLI